MNLPEFICGVVRLAVAKYPALVSGGVSARVRKVRKTPIQNTSRAVHGA